MMTNSKKDEERTETIGRMNIVLLTSEVFPFCKTGGLADQTCGLATALAENGHSVTVVTPFFSKCLLKGSPKVKPLPYRVRARIGAQTVWANLLEGQIPESGVKVIFVDAPQYFGGDRLYEGDESDVERFVTFSRLALEAIHGFSNRPDVIHANDWQTGAIPAVVKLQGSDLPFLAGVATVFTVHNGRYVGLSAADAMTLTGIGWEHFRETFEFHGQLCLLKGGLVSCDLLTTVSPNHALELQSPEFGARLDGVYRERRNEDEFVGIMNCLNMRQWNAETDPKIARNYSVRDWREGKAACKLALQQSLELPLRNETPMLGIISRADDQKGLDLVVDCAPEILSLGPQIAILASGDKKIEADIGALADRFPDQVAVRLAFSEELAHQIEAGADAFLMPSRNEPAGLNQIYSQAYGTVPVVSSRGGLADSVADNQRVGWDKATGFVFDQMNSAALFECVKRCLDTFYSDPSNWTRLVENGMREDWSWRRSIPEYEAVYRRAIAKARMRVATPGLVNG